ncbi:DNA polymerase III subunit gamma/tau [Rhodobacterales bacterium HKCCE2091]|nr:DNA polymerase III subunit gamma/tau [Rhodobacterales bacterium HKCCE2091]
MPDSPAYQVLARKYRPQDFSDLIGQEAMVRTLRNAFKSDRIAQAFILTGIRGTGKTTTARIVAKGLNCTGADGTGGPTTEPCGVCDNCKAIAEGRHPDVMEMDGASQTGVNDVRDNIISTVSYAPSSARYKIFIIDEVHMLSVNAFNALLKTLEEPPAHVKFIFATTEIRKVPVTVLSRCQRFDLRRIEPEVMLAHLRRIAGDEGAEISDGALALITRAAEGSVRDAVSLLDQAISHGAGETTADEVRAMMGLADRGRVMDLFERIMKGDAAGALAELGQQYADGADPLAILNDLAELTHWLSVLSIAPEAAEDPTVAPSDRARGQALAEGLPMRVLTRTWQMLLKAIEEVSLAPNAMMAAEMAVIRLTHVADLPTPGDLVKALQDNPPAPGTAPSAPPRTPAPPPSSPPSSGGPVHRGSHGGQQAQAALATGPEAALAHYPTFEHVLRLIESNRSIRLLVEVKTGLRLISYAPGRIVFSPTDRAPADMAQRLQQSLTGWTGVRWTVAVEAGGGAPTIAEAEAAEKDAMTAEAEAHPLMQAVRAAFPGARIAGIRSHTAIAEEAAAEALPEVDEDWDPFEDE